MKRIVTAIFALSLIMTVTTGTATAVPGKHSQFKLPSNAKLLPDGGYSLGVKTDPISGKQVEGVAYLHPRKEFAKTNPVRITGGSACYTVLAKGLRWKTAEPWLLDPINSRGLTSDFLLSHTSANLGKWEGAASANIFGNGALASGLSADTTAPDGKNEVMFGSIADPGVIAVTITWGYYNAPLPSREIVEWDQTFDDQDFDWSTSGEAAKMDYDNISTHEIGHAAGMGHPADNCTEETMYRYAGFGETKKSSLNAGDIAGIRSLY